MSFLPYLFNTWLLPQISELAPTLDQLVSESARTRLYPCQRILEVKVVLVVGKGQRRGILALTAHPRDRPGELGQKVAIFVRFACFLEVGFGHEV